MNYQTVFSVTSFGSFLDLPTKLAFCRVGGKLLWTLSRPNSTLDFSNETIDDEQIVSRVLGLPGTLCLLKLSLNWGFAAREVEQLELQLHLDWKPAVELPHCSTTLVVLKLSGNFELNLPSYY